MATPCDAVLQRQAAGQDGAAGRIPEGVQHGRIHERGGGGPDDRSLQVPRHVLGVLEPRQVLGCVHPQQILAGDRAGHEDVLRPQQPVGQQGQVDLRVLVDVEGVQLLQPGEADLVVLGIHYGHAAVHGQPRPRRLDLLEGPGRDAGYAHPRRRQHGGDQDAPHQAAPSRFALRALLRHDIFRRVRACPRVFV